MVFSNRFIFGQIVLLLQSVSLLLYPFPVTMSSPDDLKIVTSLENEESSSKDPSYINIAAVAVLPKIPTQYADESYKLFAQLGKVDDPTAEEARVIRNKCIKWILPFICIGYHIMYVDKQTVSFTLKRSGGKEGLYSCKMLIFE